MTYVKGNTKIVDYSKRKNSFLFLIIFDNIL